MLQIGLGILSRPQSVESTFKELFNVTVFSSISWNSLWERHLLLPFFYRGGNQGVRQTVQKIFFFFSNNYLGQTLLCTLLATLNSICKILCDFIQCSYLLASLSPSLSFSLSYGCTLKRIWITYILILIFVPLLNFLVWPPTWNVLSCLFSLRMLLLL